MSCECLFVCLFVCVRISLWVANACLFVCVRISLWDANVCLFVCLFVCLCKDFVVSCECLFVCLFVLGFRCELRMFVCLFKDFVVSCECNRHLKSLNLFIKYLAIRNIMLFRSVWGIERYLMILGATSADIEQVRRYRRKIIH